MDVRWEHGSYAVLGDGSLVGATDWPVGAARVRQLLDVLSEFLGCLVVAEGVI